MANIKPFYAVSNRTGLNCYDIYLQFATGFLLNDGDGIFSDNPDDKFIALAEHSVIKKYYYKNESRSIWANGLYLRFTFSRIGVPGTENPAIDNLISSEIFEIEDDAIVRLKAIKDDIAAIPTVDLTDIAKEATLAVITAKVNLIHQIEQGKWERVGSQIIMYDTDGITPLITFNIYDENGVLCVTTSNVFKRVPA